MDPTEEENQAKTSVISRLNLLHVHHKQINSLLNVYKHKVAHPMPPLKRKKLVSLKSLPKVKKEKLSKVIEENINFSQLHPKPFSTLNASNYIKNEKPSNSKNKKMMPSQYEEKVNLQKLKDAIQTNRENKRKEAKEMKESNRLMRENVLLFRENILQENIQRKKIVDARYKLIHSSIKNYKELKKEYITCCFQDAIDLEVKEISKKALLLKNLQIDYESKISQFNGNKTMSVEVIKEQDELPDSNENSQQALTNVQKFLAKKDESNTFLTGVRDHGD